ncbi:MAG: hypothetical protein BGP05_11170 [Rhizobiales bacterium 62-47]|nr:PAS domain S-box protein [Hyphomicrobiales bacterium]OJY12359.1 MAG: hypothetical protein BGP05_11170 [Rhizobiales bacterium 62-47]
MTRVEFQLRSVSDPRLAVHATSPLPAWLWSIDGAHVLWANPAGVAVMGAANNAALAAREFGPADQHRRQVSRLAGLLQPDGTPRLERLQGFGGMLGNLATCACLRLAFRDGSAGILIAAVAPVGRSLPADERMQRVVDDFDTPAAIFNSGGALAGVNAAAKSWFDVRTLGELGLDDARDTALHGGRAEAATRLGDVVLHRIGAGADLALLALIAPSAELGVPSRVTVAADETPDVAEPAPTSSDAPTAHRPIEPSPPEATSTTSTEPNVLPQSVLFDAFDDQVAEPDLPDAPSCAASDAPTTSDETKAAPEPAEVPAIAAPRGDTHDAVAPEWQDIAVRSSRRPLRFTWQMDADGHFLLGADEFTRVIGLRTATTFGRPWHEIADEFDLDPDNLVAQAVATRSTWSGITLQWPVDRPDMRLPVELSGLPVFDRTQTFIGYRGFGVCRDFDALARLNEPWSDARSAATPSPHPLTADVTRNDDAGNPSHSDTASTSAGPDHLDTPALETPPNVVHLRPGTDQKLPSLTPVENNAFNELARQLSERLELETGAGSKATEAQPDATPTSEADESSTANWLSVEDIAARGDSGRDAALLDLIPAGVLIYRLEQLLYANPAFVARIGYDSVQALRAAGGLDAIYIAPKSDAAQTADASGTPVIISARDVTFDARLFTIEWDGATALALIVNDTAATAPAREAPVVATPGIGLANAEELGAILDTTADGVVMFDGEGRINACNRSAEALFGYDGGDMVQLHLSDLFAPESQRGVQESLAALHSNSVASLLDQGREALGRERSGGFIPLSVTIGRTGANSTNFFAVFRDLTQSKKSEAELLQARRHSERGATAKADVLARVSHEIRTPLNAIIGFADVMIDERFGAIGNERYAEYLKDIRASGERVIAIVDEMLDLTRIETGKLELTFASQNLNDLVEQCVAVLQPRANRERIIIRTSLAHTLPSVVADARALRQIVLNLIGSSIHLANAGGQVIVSSALSDSGDVVFRVRDTGHGLNDSELAAALEPFGTQQTPERTLDHSGMSLSLAKALVEANRARFQIKSAPQSGTLIEVTFVHATTRA